MLTLLLFGSVSTSVRVGGEPQSLYLPPRLAALLAFLALGRGRYFPRAEIVQAVWGEGETGVGPGSLNTALWRLRRALERAPAKSGDFISINRLGAVGLNGPGQLWVDVDEFERLTHAGMSKPLHQITDADIQDMQAGIALYRGDILTDFSADWALRERERHRRMYLDALGRLMQVGAARHDYDTAIHHAQTILYADSLREDIHRELMRYFVLNGQRALALRQFEICRADLRRELAIQPMRETVALCQRIADSAISQPELERNLYAEAASMRGARLTDDVKIRVPAAPTTGIPNANHIFAARQLLAQADSHLQLSLGLADR